MAKITLKNTKIKIKSTYNKHKTPNPCNFLAQINPYLNLHHITIPYNIQQYLKSHHKKEKRKKERKETLNKKIKKSNIKEIKELYLRKERNK